MVVTEEEEAEVGTEVAMAATEAVTEEDMAEATEVAWEKEDNLIY